MSIPIQTAIVDNVVMALEDVRQSFRQHRDVSDLLNAFWCLQDHVYRLVEEASDRQGEVFSIIQSEHPHLVRDIAELLSFTLKLSVNQIPAVSQSCAAINESLQTLERLKHQPRARAASMKA